MTIRIVIYDESMNICRHAGVKTMNEKNDRPMLKRMQAAAGSSEPARMCDLRVCLC